MKTLLALSFALLILTTSCTRPYVEEYITVVPASPPCDYEPSRKPYPIKRKPIRQESVIVIDAGHGGEDFGTHSVGSPEYQEKSLNLSTAEMLRKYLEQYGYCVMMTRKEDVFIPLEKRAAMANAINSKIFVSVHYNSAPSKSAEGIEVFYFDNEKKVQRTKQSKLLAQSILNNVLKKTHAKSRGVKHGNYAVIRETTMPAVLIEGGFLTNAKEMQKIKDADYLKSLALGIAQGIRDYLTAQAL